jgi:hypothetical protein
MAQSDRREWARMLWPGPFGQWHDASVSSDLLQVLGTAPACATFFRPADSFRSKGKSDSYLETGIWQARPFYRLP